MDVEPGRLPDNAQLIDVREDYEWQAGRIPGSRHVELGAVAQSAESIDREAPVVFICRVGGRSTMAANAFRRAGYEAYSLAGGVLAWEARGLPFDGVVAEH
jgi:hydroxyacylglutathione hydrolase/adenylyltransferase/sulfurtransferase